MLRVKKNDRVRIHAMGIVCEGRVDSVYDSRVWKHRADAPFKQLIGHEPDGIEMHDAITNLPHYWKRGDGGHVYLLKPSGEWVQIFPRTIDGWILGDV